MTRQMIEIEINMHKHHTNCQMNLKFLTGVHNLIHKVPQHTCHMNISVMMCVVNENELYVQ